MSRFEEVMADDNIEINRLPIEYSAYTAVLQPSAPPDNPPPLLLAFHGYGQSCKGFIKHFEPYRERGVLVAAPQGVNQFYWENGRPGFTWMTSHMREYTIRDNMAYMGRLMGALDEKYTFDERRVFLLGFSQGVAMAFRFAAYGMAEPKGVIACGGDLPPDVEESLDQVPRFPALVVHGKEDSVVPPVKSEECLRALSGAGFETESMFFDGGHEIPPAQVDGIWAWIEKRLQG